MTTKTAKNGKDVRPNIDPTINNDGKQPAAADHSENGEEIAIKKKIDQGELRPGALRGKTTITLETTFATHLFYGKYGKDVRIIGLRKFASTLAAIWKNAPHDPWALWYLVRIEEATDKAQAALESLLQRYELQINNQKKIDHKQSFSQEPIKIDINFAAPLAYRGAKLVVTADEVIRLILHAHHVDLIDDKKTKQDLFKVGNQVRKTFELAVTYQEMGVSYKTLKEMAPEALKAIDAMGEIPAEILAGEKLPRHMPKVHLSTNKPSSQKTAWADQMVKEFFTGIMSNEENSPERKG